MKQWRHTLVLLMIKYHTPVIIYSFILKLLNTYKPRYELYCTTCASMYPAIFRVVSSGGVDQCANCSDISSFGESINMEPQSMKESRKEYAKSLIQPYRNGEASAEYAEAYPDRAKRMFKGKTVKEVWKDTLPHYWRKTK